MSRAAHQRVKIMVYNGHELVREVLPEKSTMLVGRMLSHDLPLPDFTVSRTHCSIEIGDNGTRVTDMSHGGTYIDHTRVGPNGAHVPDGATIQIGAFELRIVLR